MGASEVPQCPQGGRLPGRHRRLCPRLGPAAQPGTVFIMGVSSLLAPDICSCCSSELRSPWCEPGLWLSGEASTSPEWPVLCTLQGQVRPCSQGSLGKLGQLTPREWGPVPRGPCFSSAWFTPSGPLDGPEGQLLGQALWSSCCLSSQWTSPQPSAAARHQAPPWAPVSPGPAPGGGVLQDLVSCCGLPFAFCRVSTWG